MIGQLLVLGIPLYSGRYRKEGTAQVSIGIRMLAEISTLFRILECLWEPIAMAFAGNQTECFKMGDICTCLSNGLNIHLSVKKKQKLKNTCWAQFFILCRHFFVRVCLYVNNLSVCTFGYLREIHIINVGFSQ